MKTIVFVCLCVAAALSAPAEERPERSLPALEHVHETDELGQYSLKYVTAEGTVVSEVGRLVPTPEGGKVLVHEGEFTFVGDDNKKYVTKYKTTIAGAYEVEGDHLPKPVEPEPVPELPKVEAPALPEPPMAKIAALPVA